MTQHLTGTEELPGADASNRAERVGAAATAARANARRAIEAAERAFPGWSATPPAERRGLLQRASELLLERQADIAALVTEETGGTVGWGMFNVQLAAGMLAYYAGQADAPAEEQEIPSHIPGKRAKAVRQPVGVVVGIAPWNAPVVLGVRAVAAPLAYGNTVVLKASEQCPRTHAAIVDALKDAGLPAGAINLVANDPEDAAELVDELIAHPAVRRINFTGSTRVGRIIAEKAARHLKRVLLELGGKAPLVVLADADLERAVAAATFGSFIHQGQICMSTERIVIDRSVADEFAQMLGERASSLKIGDPREPSTQIGPLVSEDALTRVREHVEDAVAKGAKVVAGGKADGALFEPTVLMGVTPEMRVYSEESFGAGRRDRDGRRCRRGGARRQRHRVRALIGGVQRGRGRGDGRCAPAGDWHVPHQRRDRQRRATDALRRRQAQWLGPFRRQGGARGVHRASLDQHSRQPAPVPDLAI